MRRLSIIDLSHRPPADPQRGPDGLGRLQRRDLQLPRAAARARSGRPPVLHGHRHRGHRPRVRAMGRRRRSRGCAACSGSRIWDTRTRTLLVARDRIGIKPMHYATVNGRLYFGSEIKSLLVAPGSAPRPEHRRARSLPVVSLHAPRRLDLHARPQAAARPPADVAGRARSPSSRTGSCRPQETFRGSEADAVDQLRDVLTDAVRVASGQRRAARRVPLRRRRLEPRRRR